jgi:glycosyltransferase involved in cell wall biosynthesis
LPELRRHYRKLLPFFPAMIRSLPTGDYDLVIATSHCVAKGAPPPERGALLAYIFSPMRYIWDHYEDYLSGKPLQDSALRLARRPLQNWDRSSSQRVDSFVADSRHVAEKVTEYWGRRCGVIYPPVDLKFFTPGSERGGEKPYFLVVSALVPYKMVDRAVEACRLAGKRLVVVGDGPERARLVDDARGDAEFRGWLSDQDLREVYRGCEALLYPGVEDFGITALEAMACGRPVLALRDGGASESVLDGVTGSFFDEPRAQALAGLLTRFRSESYNSSEIRSHAEQFSSERFREEFSRWVLKEARLRC